MNKPLLSHNSYSATFASWYRTQDKESITRTILENATTQFQFRTDGPADDSGDHNPNTNPRPRT